MKHLDSYDVSCDNDILMNEIDSHIPQGLPQVLPMEPTEEVVRYYSPMVYRIALTKTQSSHDADDIFQDVFLRVTINCCNSHFTMPWRKNIDSLDDALLAQIPAEDCMENILSDGPDVYAEVLKLPQNMREVILLYYYEEMSIREISQILQTTEVNIKKRLSRARQKLKLELSEEDNE